MIHPRRLVIFLFGFFLGGILPTVLPPPEGWGRFLLFFLVIRMLDTRIPPSLSLGRLGFLFGLFVDAFKVGS
jgi:hypothetical protein